VWSVEKAALYGKLRRVKKSVPDFPLIPQIYYSHPSCGSFPPDFPCVVKVGSSSQGVGKAKVSEMDQWKDSLSLLAMTTEYFVTEPFINWKKDVRVQKIGKNYRAIERVKMSDQSPWKANEGIGISENDVPVKDTWKKWLDAAAEELEMDICGMDLISDDKGNEFILELNSSSIGLPARHANEDTRYICDVVLEKLNEIYSNNTTTTSKTTSTSSTSSKSPKKTTEKKGKEKKICCACPDTKRERDECVLMHGEEGCKDFIEAHKACLRKEGFKV
jgi:cytochrome c oxidase assembly protein subunit 17